MQVPIKVIWFDGQGACLYSKRLEKGRFVWPPSRDGKLGVSRIATAENGVEAIERLRQADPTIDIIICDIDMPEMTGWEFIREIRGGTVPNCEDIPILLLTGLNTDYTLVGEQNRIDGFITKLATADHLRAHMVRVLGLSDN